MATYSYKAKSLSGEEKSGTIEAKDQYQLAGILRGQGLVLIKADSQEKKFSKKFNIDISFGVPLSEKMFFTRNLQVMVSAGLSIPRSIDIISLQAKNKAFRGTLLDVRERVTKGQKFSDAIAAHPKTFPDIFQSMVKVGEETGTMEEVLKVLSVQMERSYELNSKVKGAMTYPMVILTVMLGIGTLMLVTVVPQISKVFGDMGVELPMATKVVIALGNFVATKWYFALAIVAVLAVSSITFLKTATGKRLADSFLVKAPLISPIIKDINSAYTVRNLSSLAAAGVPLPRSLEITAGTVGNGLYKKALLAAADKVRKGEKLSEVLKNYSNIYPQTIIQMIAVGEETGETSAILAKLADFFEDAVSEATKNITSIIEPVMMVIIGGVVGFFAVSIMQPIQDIMTTIK